MVVLKICQNKKEKQTHKFAMCDIVFIDHGAITLPTLARWAYYIMPNEYQKHEQC